MTDPPEWLAHARNTQATCATEAMLAIEAAPTGLSTTADRPRYPDSPGTRLARRATVIGALAATILLTGSCDASRRSTDHADDSPRSSASAPPAANPSLSAACDAPATRPHEAAVTDLEQQLTIGGRTRTYRVDTPAIAEPGDQLGVILNLHGAGSNARQQRVYSAFGEAGPAAGYIVATPDAIDGHWQLTPDGDDADFLLGILDTLSARYCVDLGDVHAAGISLGAWKATATACGHSDRIASIALVAENVAPEGCAMPVLAFHGTADAVVPFGTGADAGVVVTGTNRVLPGVEVNLPKWATNGGCSLEPAVERIEPDVTHSTYTGCRDGIDVELYAIDGGGHTWPGSTADVAWLGRTTATVDATQLAIDFFRTHRR